MYQEMKYHIYENICLHVQKGLEAIKVSDRLTSCTSSQSDGQGDCRVHSETRRALEILARNCERKPFEVA